MTGSPGWSRDGNRRVDVQCGHDRSRENPSTLRRQPKVGADDDTVRRAGIILLGRKVTFELPDLPLPHAACPRPASVASASRAVASSASAQPGELRPVRWSASANRTASSHSSQFRAALAMVGESLLPVWA